ncbi:MAG: hypothetical protein M3P08_20705 [Thermoproteota archaeon]|nr:hypothetical protein [Thermoproteota archaeon]
MYNKHLAIIEKLVEYGYVHSVSAFISMAFEHELEATLYDYDRLGKI